MNVLRRTVALATICLIGGCGSGGDLEPGPTPAAELVIGFGHYGALKVGMSRDALLAATPVKLTEYGGNPACAWLADSRYPVQAPYGELHVTLDDKNKLVGIDAPSAARTDRGVTVGSSRDQVIAAHDDPVDEGANETGDYMLFGSPNEGWLTFNLNSSGAVVLIRTGTKEYASGMNVCSGD
ncbi:hypothetical protein MED01_003099 [Micromonospora sp. MED01]|uniref:hypothetical protein n=1 Tax=Micromonospora alfalfae TaxID=2911212 RepID=UPI001EE7C039|nr:hypothetical protein [Micromonospora alfalfae]MCG5464842.1 hypothetical protein [Micromonospora alfalfae]